MVHIWVIFALGKNNAHLQTYDLEYTKGMLIYETYAKATLPFSWHTHHNVIQLYDKSSSPRH